MTSCEYSNIMPSSLEQCLERVISERRLTVLFQPIISNKSREVYGYEALIRGPSNTPLHAPVSLFETAVRHGRLVDLELLCREISIRQFRRLNLPGKLFLNASPETLFQPGFRSGCTLDMLRREGLSPSRVVIELTEHYPLDNYEVVREALQHYREMGFEIAIDDLGAGYAGLRMWSELRPDYVKIDRHFMQDIHEDEVKQEFVRSIRNIARGLDCRVIGEGVETAEEYRIAINMGLEFCQGYYFSRPASLPETRVPSRLFRHDPEGLSREAGRGYLSKSVGELLQRVVGIAASTSVEDAAQIFHAIKLESLPIVDNGRPLGLLRRSTITRLLLNRYGRDLHGKKRVTQFIDHTTLMLESHLPIEQASKLVSERMQHDKELEFIITEEGRYRGTGSVVDILKVITDLQVRNARYANPLTLLPGNVPIYEELDHLLRQQQPFVVGYCDLDNFKPYNDKYGYEKGDQVIKGLAEILCNGVDETQDFVGHIGGDDFIIIFRSSDWEGRCRAILRQFEERVRRCYKKEDLKQNGIWSQDREGNHRLFPLLSLSIGCVNPDPDACNSHHDVAALASDAKRMAKKQDGNSLFIEQRRRPQSQNTLQQDAVSAA